LDPGYFNLAFATLVAFGGREEWRIAAGYPETGYRNPNVTIDEAFYTEIRAVKAWLQGDEDLARREGQKAVKTCHEAVQRPGYRAFLSLVDNDQVSFCEHLGDRVKGYKKQYQRGPNSPEGFVFLFGLALCRLAQERGMSVEDGAYLPVRLLPSFPGTELYGAEMGLGASSYR